MLKNEIHQYYGNKIRVRVCGVLIIDAKLLMLKHDGIGELNFFWNTPGGEPEKGENLHNTLIREFKEETNLDVTLGKLLTINEFIAPPLHAIEYYFEVRSENNSAVLGNDPENVNVLSELKWFTKMEFVELNSLCKPTFLLKYLNFG
jgi:8-oxo-dGTP diphosphatase